ncbi:RNA methyltransferase [Geothermobacter hydrogeniphilus]|uniref:tRNA (cytidine/uridine-2'-O-)-methyltransferase TrmJ n=1 Tax=Geothermobacter hydrogeniphilus TaxID=1969733 RepID=A0A1X0YE05_9BACT|nr:RNA methyltransferase [Geothermobacter hydrogeniphilus]ORJ63445.1 RNA methyltransferase [Geothermobacter hydrogeniphilus]
MKDVNARLENILVVLVEPQGGLNIGSVCRVMANFGLSRLRLVNPQVDHLGDDARRMAVKAAPLLERAEVFSDLPSALADCTCSIGTTRRFGKYRENLFHPDQAARHFLPLSAAGQVALIFGREDRGLHNEELDLCQRLMTIPTREPVASMNLAQAVAVCLYEVQKVWGELAGKAAGGKRLASGEDLEQMFRHMRRTLLDIEFLDPQNPDHILRAFRQILGRAGLSAREVRILQGLWSRIDWVEGERRKSVVKGEG